MNSAESANSSEPTCYLRERANGGPPYRADGFVTDWAGLHPGEQVQVYRDAEMLTAGTVDATMPDGTGVWLMQHRGLGRRLYYRCEDLRIAGSRYS